MYTRVRKHILDINTSESLYLYQTDTKEYCPPILVPVCLTMKPTTTFIFLVCSESHNLFQITQSWHQNHTLSMILFYQNFYTWTCCFWRSESVWQQVERQFLLHTKQDFMAVNHWNNKHNLAFQNKISFTKKLNSPHSKTNLCLHTKTELSLCNDSSALTPSSFPLS